MKKQYIKPEQCVVALRHSMTLLDSSPILIVDPESGGDIAPDISVDEGLGRELSDFENWELDY